MSLWEEVKTLRWSCCPENQNRKLKDIVHIKMIIAALTIVKGFVKPNHISSLISGGTSPCRSFFSFFLSRPWGVTEICAPTQYNGGEAETTSCLDNPQKDSLELLFNQEIFPSMFPACSVDYGLIIVLDVCGERRSVSPRSKFHSTPLWMGGEWTVSKPGQGEIIFLAKMFVCLFFICVNWLLER